jgi:hypothetical protein
MVLNGVVVFFSRLEPLVLRIKEKRSAILCPGIDMISDQNMAYGVRKPLTSIDTEFELCRARAMVVLVVSGGRCILIGFPFRHAFAMHKKHASILIRSCSIEAISDQLHRIRP